MKNGINIPNKDYENSIRIIENKAKKYKIIITTGIKDFIFLHNLIR